MLLHPTKRWIICASALERDAIAPGLLGDGAVCVVPSERSMSLFRTAAGWLPLSSTFLGRVNEQPPRQQESGEFTVITPPRIFGISENVPRQQSFAVFQVGDPPGFVGTALETHPQQQCIVAFEVSSDELIPTDRLTVWDPGLNAIGGIPNYTTISSTLSPSGGNDTAAINAAIDAANAAWLSNGVGRVVKLNSGDFQIDGQGLVVRSGVVVRGNGPTLTRLHKSPASQYPVAIIGHRWWKYSSSIPLAVNGVFGATTLQLASLTVAGHALAVGDLIIVNQKPDPAVVDWGTHVGPPGDPSRAWFCELDRPLGQILEITNVNAGTNVVTFNTPLRHAFSLTYEAHVCMFSDTPGGGPANVTPTRLAGIEDLYLELGEGGDGGGNLHVFAAKYCWIKNVESAFSQGHSVNFDGCFRCECRDSFLRSTVDPNPGGAGYGSGVNQYTSDCLFENNIVWNFNKLSLARASGGGNVWGYNYMDDGYGDGYREIVEIGGGPNHYATAHHDLFEGNRCFNYDTESYWGNSIYATVFRNHFTALRANDPNLANPLMDAWNRRAVGMQTSCWWHSFVGNVLGSAGQTLLSGTDFHGNSFAQTSFIYQASLTDVDNASAVPMWKLGYDGTTHPSIADPLVVARTYRHGNFDYVSNDIVWDPDVTNHTIPNSLYLDSKPAFMGSKAWPWVTPENISIPIADTLPAYDRFVAWSAAQ
jgi:hypothetical protein